MTVYSLIILFPNFEPVPCSMSGSNCCFLTCIQISQEAGKVVWYSHLLKNFLWFVVLHIVKGFSVVNEAKVDVFLEFSCFFYDPADAGNLVSSSSAFSKSSLNIWSSQLTFCWSLAWKILSITLLACEMSAILQPHHTASRTYTGLGNRLLEGTNKTFHVCV